MLKDVSLALETDKTDKGLALLKQAKVIYSSGEKNGVGDEDMISLYKLIHH